MRTNRIFAIAAAVIAVLAACTKEQAIETGSSFKKGQEVTLNVTADASATKVSSELNGTAIDFKWQSGDKILVTVGTESAEFTLSSGAGSANATFTGTMPADGETFDVQYPVADPVLTTQTYSSTEAIPHDKMKFAATGCTTSSPFSLSAQNAALRLNLYGTDQTVGKIVVTNMTSTNAPKPTYTLTMDPAVTLPTTEATAKTFFIVVPAGDWNFSAEVYDNAATPAKICTFSPSAAKTFTANTVLNMPAKEVKKAMVLLPGEFSVSATKKVNFTKGNLWWGKKGSETTAVWHLEDNQTDYQTAWNADHVSHLYWTKTAAASYAETYNDGTNDITDVPFFAESEGGLIVDGQNGLYVLTKAEWAYLIGSRTSGLYKYGVTVTNGSDSYTNCLIIAPDDYSGTALSSVTDWSLSNINNLGLVCLPAAGYREGSSLYNGGSLGYSWSATLSEDFVKNAYSVYFYSGTVFTFNYDYRYRGLSVRLVCAAQ